jgi:ABC-type hemin transport system ATPase subunit
VVVVLHDLNLARRIANRVVVLHQGTVQGAGDPETILASAFLEKIYGVPAAFF